MVAVRKPRILARQKIPEIPLTCLADHLVAVLLQLRCRYVRRGAWFGNGGPIRQPASWCGVVGVKPTYGRVSRYGVVAMGSSLDSPGPMGKTVSDCALLLNSIAGYDSQDATTSDRSVPDFTRGLDRGVKNMKIGLCYVDHPKLAGTPASDAVIQAGKLLKILEPRWNASPLQNS